MRTLYDSITAADVPSGSELVAGYVDGFRSKWSDPDWLRFPGRKLVRISVLGNDADVLDVENGAQIPSAAPFWAARQRAAGRTPTVYVNLSNEAAVRAAFDAAGEPQPLYWLAHYGAPAVLPAGYIALQYANEPITGGHYDASVVADFWPGVDMTIPTRIAQSADLQLKPGELGQLAAIFSYPPDHPAGRTVLVKVRGDRPGRRVIAVYPPTDVDADATMLIDAEPALFVVDILPDTLPQP